MFVPHIFRSSGKKTGKRLSLLLAAALLFVSLPLSASAEEEEPVLRTETLDCASFTGDEANEEEGWSWKNADKTLTLNDFLMLQEAEALLGIKLPADSTIVLAGENGNVLSGMGVSGCGIQAEGDLTIEGGGALTITLANEESASAFQGIQCTGNLTFDLTDGQAGGVMVVVGPVTEGDCLGIAAAGNVTVSGGNIVTMAGGAGGNGRSAGIRAVGDITVSGGTLMSVAGLGGTSGSQGLYAKNLTVEGGLAVGLSGISLEGDIDGAASNACIGVYTENSLTVSGGSLMAAVNPESENACAFYNAGSESGSIEAANMHIYTTEDGEFFNIPAVVNESGSGLAVSDDPDAPVYQAIISKNLYLDNLWDGDEEQHWHPAICGDDPELRFDLAAHVWDNGEILWDATETEEGEKLFTCLICQLTRTETIPTLEKPTVPTTPSSSSSSTDTTVSTASSTSAKPTSPKTGDSGSALPFSILAAGALGLVVSLTLSKRNRSRM